MIQQTRAFKQKVAFTLVLFMVFEVTYPTAALALTGGPQQPEFEKFTPVATTDMVNSLTGDFQYNLPVLNIPGADGGGYALSLSYNANPSMDSEASWVGANWTLNPGALIRSKSGLPDDYKGKVKEYNVIKPSFSFSRTQGGSVNVGFGEDNSNNIGVSSNITHTWNNYSGYGDSKYIGLSTNIPIDLSVGVTFGGRDATFSANVTIGPKLEAFTKQAKDNLKDVKGAGAWGKRTLLNIAESNELRLNVGTSGQFGIFGQVNSSVAASVKPHRAMSYTFGGTAQALLGPVTAAYNRSETATLQVNKPVVDYHAYGYMYNPNHGTHDYHARQATPEHVMSDYGIEKNSNFSARDNIIGIVHNNADQFNAIGEGISGSYRMHHKKVGHYYSDWAADGRSRNVSVVPNITGGAGFVLSEGATGVGFKIGANFQFENRTKTESRMWLVRPNSWGMGTNVDAKQFEDPSAPTELPFFKAKNDVGGALLYVHPDRLDDAVREYRGGFMGTIATSDNYGNPVVDGDLISFERPHVSQFIEDSKHAGSDYYKGGSGNMEYVLNSDLAGTHPSYDDISPTKAFDKHQRVLQYLDSDPFTNTAPVLGNGSVANSELSEHIAQIKVWNPNGVKYTYGLPVYVRDEANFTYGIDLNASSIGNEYGCSAQRPTKLENNNIVYPMVSEGSTGDSERNLKIKQGQQLEEWYANSYLMTQITTPDYVDLTGDGATEDDFGGYTRFDYRRWVKNKDHSGDNMNNWYRFRAPYTGLKYNPGEHAKKSDDIGSVSHGYREMYYLNGIETKSHVAIFITNKSDGLEDFKQFGIESADFNGSGDTRNDGLGQVMETPNTEPLGFGPSDVNRSSVPSYGCYPGANYTRNGYALNSKDAKDLFQDVEKLEKIVLFAKSDLTKPLVTTCLEYDYSAWENIPNNSQTQACNPGNGSNKGKLTLKKVWFEYEGVRKHKVSPYEFEYEYAKVKGSNPSIAQEVLNRYPAIFDPAQGGDWPTAGATSLAETPYYNQHAIDRWGNLAYDGEQRRFDYKHWLYQGVYDNTQGYDPAAWMLKQIKLPSGGEIHIQYEEKTYQKVQDKQALAMVSLLDGISVDDSNDGTKNKFYLNLKDLGIEGNTPKKEELVRLIKDLYMQDSDPLSVDYGFKLKTKAGKKDDRIYFKFKYELEEGSAEEYISGYGVVREVGIDNNNDKVYLSIGNALDKPNFVDRKDIPRQLCYDHITANNYGNYDFDYAGAAYDFLPSEANSHSRYDNFKAEVEGTGNPIYTYGNHVDDAGFTSMQTDFTTKEYPDYAANSTCKSINYAHSFIRVPMVTPKRGGGVRVKRVLMYDDGMESGDAQLFGMEYDYVKEDGTCSGVATNEPGEGREENALIYYEKRKDTNPFLKIFAGEDRKEGEMPYGEFLLPPPSVNYSRVVVSSIYKGTQQNEGFSVKEYFTTEDYPTNMRFDDPKFGILEGFKSVQKTELGSGFPSIEDVRLNYRRESFLPLSLGLFNYNRHFRWMTQAFMFIQTNMNGKVKSEQTYAGVYNRDYFANPTAATDTDISLTSKTTYEYIEPGEKAKILTHNGSSYELQEQHLGVEDDVTMAAQAVYEESFSSGMNLSFLIAYFGGISVSPSLGLNFSFGERGMARHMTTRILSFPSVLKSITTEMNKSISKVEHLAYSDLTGTPILTKTTDGYDRNVVVGPTGVQEHDGSIYKWNIPAAWFYNEMGKKSVDPNNTNQLMATVGSVTSYGADGNPIASNINTWATNPTGVLSASAVTLSKTDANAAKWFDETPGSQDPLILEYAPSASNPHLVAEQLNKLYRVFETYVYDPTTGASSANDNGTNNWGQANQKTYKSGINDHFTMFNWTGTNPDWTAVTRVNKYSPNGYSLEELDLIAEVPSAAKYGYKKYLSTAIAQNATYNTIGFESFEDEKFANATTPHPSLVNGGHAGKYALTLTNTPITIIDNLKVNNRVTNPDLGNGLMVRLWARNELVGSANRIKFSGAKHIDVKLTSGGTTFSPNAGEKVIAQVGEWLLLEYVFEPANLSASNNIYELKMNVTGSDANGNTLTTLTIDDVRIQPINSEMTTHVYDNKSFKLIATFGSEHFGAFYQYNGEGDLIRTLIETERGMKTIQENQGNSPLTHQPLK